MWVYKTDGYQTKKGDKIELVADQICEDQTEEMCWIIEGALKALMQASNKNAVVKHTKCQFHGDEHCVFEVYEEK